VIRLLSLLVFLVAGYVFLNWERLGPTVQDTIESVDQIADDTSEIRREARELIEDKIHQKLND
jgi:hypothetical protein